MPSTQETDRYKVPQFESAEDLAAHIDVLAHFEHDGGESGYSASADALWKAAAAAFEYVARECGVTGFQASWAALRFYAEVMHVDGPFAIFKAADALYPQYDLPGRLQGYLGSEWREWLREQARKRLEEDNDFVAERVISHWHWLAGDPT